MRMIVLTFSLFWCVPALVGCSGRPIAGGGDGKPPVSGIYALTETRSSSCNQTILKSDQIHTFTQSHDATRIWIESMARPYTPDKPATEAMWLANGRFENPIDLCGGQYRNVITLVGMSSDWLAAKKVESWTGMEGIDWAGCPVPYLLPDVGAVEGCTTTTELKYELFEPCSAECLQFDQTRGLFDNWTCGC